MDSQTVGNTESQCKKKNQSNKKRFIMFILILLLIVLIISIFCNEMQNKSSQLILGATPTGYSSTSYSPTSTEFR
jgi:hypothetical protein